ncbi:MAG: YHYH protein [Verrucomicrobiota bacterium]
MRTLLILSLPLAAFGQSLPDPAVSIETQGAFRIVKANGIPNHPTGTFPNRGNPHRIQAQNHLYRLPLHPSQAAQLTPLERQPFGVALNGIPFDPNTAEFWNDDRRSGWRYAAMTGHLRLGTDQNHAHVQSTGAYHYHGIPTGLLRQLPGSDEETLLLVGYAADGFPIYVETSGEGPRPSYQLKEGLRPDGPGGAFDGRFLADFEYVDGLGDLDEANGTFGSTPEYPEGIYHYYLTDTFPFVPRYFKGTPDPSLRHRGRGPSGQRQLRNASEERSGPPRSALGPDQRGPRLPGAPPRR